MSAGRASFIGELEVASFPHTETLVVLEGELTLTAAGGGPLVIGPNAGAVIGCGTRVRIRAESRVQFVWCANECERLTRPGVFALRPDANFKSSAPPPAETLLGPTPECRNDVVFTEEDGRLRAGTWDSTPYHRVVRPHPLNEFMVLLDGSARFESPDGSVLSAHAGDALFVPKSAPVGWESRERVAKFFVVQSVQA